MRRQDRCSCARKARTPRTVLARFSKQRCFVETAPWIRPAQQECSLRMALKNVWTALQDLGP